MEAPLIDIDADVSLPENMRAFEVSGRVIFASQDNRVLSSEEFTPAELRTMADYLDRRRAGPVQANQIDIHLPAQLSA